MTQPLTYDPYYAGPTVYDAPSTDSTPTVVELNPGPQTQEPVPETAVVQPVDQQAVLDVPEGPAAKVLGWVGEDAERASAALEAEKAGQGRKTLIGKLQAILEG